MFSRWFDGSAWWLVGRLKLKPDRARLKRTKLPSVTPLDPGRGFLDIKNTRVDNLGHTCPNDLGFFHEAFSSRPLPLLKFSRGRVP